MGISTGRAPPPALSPGSRVLRLVTSPEAYSGRKRFCTRIARHVFEYTRASARLQPGRSKRMRVVAGGPTYSTADDATVGEEHVSTPTFRI